MENIELKKEILATAGEYIKNVVKGIGEIVENFQRGREDKATSMMLDLIDGIQWLIKAIDGTKDQQGENPIEANLINPILGQLVEAFENMDYVLVSDLLQYELLPVIEGWKNQLSKIQGE